MFLRILKVKEEVFPSSYNYFDQNNTPRFQYGDLQMTRDQRAPFSAPGAALNYFLKRPHTLLTFDAVLNVDLGSKYYYYYSLQFFACQRLIECIFPTL